MAQQQADALALLAETALHHGLDPGAPGERYQVVVHVDASVLADPDQPGQSVLEDGAHVPAEPSMWLPPLPVTLKRNTIARGGTKGRSRYWCQLSPSRNLTWGVARYPVVWPQRARCTTTSENARVARRFYAAVPMSWLSVASRTAKRAAVRRWPVRVSL